MLHALKGFEVLIVKIAVCPRRFSSPAAGWLLDERFKTRLEEVLGEGEFTEDEERPCLVFRPREWRRGQGMEGEEGVLGPDQELFEV